MMFDYKSLCTAIEQELRRTPSAPSDFKWISEQIEERTRERLSASTLMRLWGYMDGVTPRKVTLDILARSLGYMGYEDFMAHQAGTRGQEGEGVQGVQDVQGVQGVQRVQGVQGVQAPIPSKSKPKRRAWAVGIAAVVALVIVAGSIRLLSSKPNPVYVTDLSQLTNTKQYIIHTRHDKRGLLGVNERPQHIHRQHKIAARRQVHLPLYNMKGRITSSVWKTTASSKWEPMRMMHHWLRATLATVPSTSTRKRTVASSSTSRFARQFAR